MKAKMEDPLKLPDAQGGSGSAAGLQQLEAAVSTYNEALYADKSVPVADKLQRWSGELIEWLAAEPADVINGTKCLAVLQHATFGKLKASISNSLCTCTGGVTGGEEPATSACLLHCPQPHLPDIVYEVLRQTHATFGDCFVCFTNLLFDETARGTSIVLRLEPLNCCCLFFLTGRRSCHRLAGPRRCDADEAEG